MQCPCKTCEKRGCGTAHDSCPEYKAWVRERALANARKYAHEDVTNAIVQARLRINGRKKR